MTPRFNLAELLELCPTCSPPFELVLTLLPQQQPRYYSIASSPLKDAKLLRIAFTVVTYPVTLFSKCTLLRKGLCSNWLASLTASSAMNVHERTETTLPVVQIALRDTREFLLPANPKWPLILIGPGTGVSPFMGFLQHREHQNHIIQQQKSSICSGFWRGFEVR